MVGDRCRALAGHGVWTHRRSGVRTECARTNLLCNFMGSVAASTQTRAVFDEDLLVVIDPCDEQHVAIDSSRCRLDANQQAVHEPKDRPLADRVSIRKDGRSDAAEGRHHLNEVPRTVRRISRTGEDVSGVVGVVRHGRSIPPTGSAAMSSGAEGVPHRRVRRFGSAFGR